jgi:hypothetical protein
MLQNEKSMEITYPWFFGIQIGAKRKWELAFRINHSEVLHPLEMVTKGDLLNKKKCKCIYTVSR